MEGLAGGAGLVVLSTGEVDVPDEARDVAQLEGGLEFDLIQSGLAETFDRRGLRRQSTSRRTIATVPTITISTRSAVGERRLP